MDIYADFDRAVTQWRKLTWQLLKIGDNQSEDFRLNFKTWVGLSYAIEAYLRIL